MNSKMDSKAELFKGLIFHIEIITEGKDMHSNFAHVLQKAKGRVAKILTKKTTHLIWSGGSVATLQKAMKFEDIEIVSPLWIQACLEQEELVDCAYFRPINLEKILSNLKKKESESIKSFIFKGNDQSLLTDPKYQKMTQESTPLSEEDLLNIEKRLHRIQEDKYFEKEYAKDIKKIAKSENKKNKKTDFYDSFADDKIDCEVFFEKQDQKLAKGKKAKGKENKNNNILMSKFLNKPSTLQPKSGVKIHVEKKNLDGLKMDFNDILAHMNDSESEPNQTSEEVKSSDKPISANLK